MAESNFIIDLVAKLQDKISLAQLNGDIKSIQKSLNKIELKAGLDPSSVQDIARQLKNIANQRIDISNISVDQGQVSKIGQQTGKTLGENVNKNLAASLNAVKQDIENVLKGFGGQKLSSYDLSKMFNLNRADIDGSVTQKVRNLTNELNALAKEALKTDADGAWEGIVNKISALSGVLNQFGKSRDLSSFKESLDVLNYFQGKKIFIDDKSELLQNTGMSVRELNNQFRNLGVTFTTVSRNATRLDSVWSELFNISPNLQQFTTFGDQINAIVSHLKTAKEAMYGNGNLQPLNGQEVTNVLLDWMGNLENASKKLKVLRDEQSEMERQTAQSSTSAADTAIQNEERKQQSYRQTLRELNALNNFKQNTLPQARDNVSNGFYADQVQQQIEKYNRLGIELPNVKARIDELKAAERELDSVMGNENSTIEQQMSACQKFQAALRSAKASNSIASNMYMSQNAVDGLIAKLHLFLQENTAMTGTAKAEINEWIAKLQQTGNVYKSMGNEAVSAMKRIEAEQGKVGKLGDSMVASLKKGFSFLSYWISPMYLFMKAVQSVKSGISSVKELDTALVDLKKTTSMTARELERFYYDADDVAKQMGVTTKEILEQAAAWSRLGFSSAEQSSKMAKYSSMFKMISPGMDLDSSTDGLVSVMKAFEIGLEDADEVVDGIMSKINIIGNSKALSNSDIVEFLTRSSSAMASANNSLEETIALGEAAVEITRDAANAGQVLKTTSMRIRGYDEETESYTQELENLKGEIADLTKTAKTPGGISLFTDETKETYKSTYEILEEISEIWDDLTDKNQAQLLETLAGKRNGQALAAIISNFDSARESMELMANSAGNADAEMSIVMDSLDYKLNRLAETGTSVAQNLFKRDDMKEVVDATTSVMNVIDALTSKLGLFGTAISSVSIAAFVKNFA